MGLLLFGLAACQRSSAKPEPVTITLLDPGWLDKEFLNWRIHEEEEFAKETGIVVKDFAAPETAIDQLALLRTLVQNPASAPDVFAIDVIWPAVTADYALDLKPYLQDTTQDFQVLVANNTVNGKLVAMPYHADAGLLFYRTDLLTNYGYKNPPRTWDELEKMAARIQAGERAKGKTQFWGYIWQGAPSEALTCNALEWQVSEGGGHIIEPDGKISVNNPRAIHSWQRAQRWVGSISPPSVVAYREWDTLNIWRSGNAAFMRNWPTSFLISQSHDSAVRQNFSATALPGGQVSSTGALGGASLSVFRYSRHPKEAVALVRYLCRRDVERRRSIATTQPPVMPELFVDPDLTGLYPHFADLKELFAGAAAMRPSTITGSQYTRVSEAYFQAVHSVLTKQRSGPEAAADLEKVLASITGLTVAQSTPDRRQ
jgi:trehalose/maltose transport system substrate-binding protein